MRARLSLVAVLSLLALALGQPFEAEEESDLLALEGFQLYERGGSDDWLSRALSDGMARDMLRCVRQCSAGRSNVSSAPPPSCPSAKLMDYLLRGASGVECDTAD